MMQELKVDMSSSHTMPKANCTQISDWLKRDAGRDDYVSIQNRYECLYIVAYSILYC